MRLPLFAWKDTLRRLNKRVVVKRRKNHQRAIRLESLETRTLMTVTPWFDSGELYLVGDGADDTIVLAANGAGNVTLGGSEILGGVAASSVTALLIEAGGGNDYIDLNGVVPSSFTSLMTGSIVVYCQTGNDIAYGSPIGDLIYGDAGNDYLVGNGGNDALTGSTGDDVYDFVGSLLGSDSIYENANEGTDFLNFRYFSGAVDVDLSYTGPREVNDGNLTIDLYHGAAIEVVVDSQYDDSIRGNSLNNYFYTLGGTDRLEGGSGDDMYLFTDANLSHDTIIEDAGGGGDFLYFADYAYGVNVSLSETSEQEVAEGHLSLTLQNSIGDVADLNYVYGTAFDDVLTGNNLLNYVYGLGGNDVLYGMGSSDTLGGGDGNDTLWGGDSGDALYGDAGNDTIYGQESNDTLYGGTGNDTLIAGAGNDTVYGEDDNDVLYVGSGGDALVGGLGSDTYVFEADVGDANSDTLIETTSTTETDTLDFSSFSGAYAANLALNLTTTGSQVIVANKARAALMAEAAFEKVIGGAGDDSIIGNSRNNLILGGDGNDTLTGGAGNDDLQGGAGNDTYKHTWSSGDLGSDTVTDTAGTDKLDFSGVSAAVVVDLGLASQQTIFSQSGTPKLKLTLGSATAIEDVLGSSSSDIITGNSLNNALQGGGGNDTYKFVWTSGSTLGSDTITDASGTDWLDFSGVATGVAVNLGITTLQTIINESGTPRLQLTLAGANAIENVRGSSYADTITGSAIGNILEGGVGNDSLTGGAGQDFYRFWGTADLGIDSITEASNADYDTLDFSQAGYGATINLGLTSAQTVIPGKLTLTLFSETSIEGVYGTAYADTITGNTRDNYLWGAAGNDTIYGSSGYDTLDGDVGDDHLYGGADDDTLMDGDGNDYVYGEAGDDYLNYDGMDPLESLGDDLFSGGDGSDYFYSGSGTDTLQGDAGDDTYYFSDWWESASITVDESIDQGTDTLDFSYFNSGITVNLGLASEQPISPGVLALTLVSDSAVENVFGSYYNDSIIGNSLSNVIEGYFGNDTLSGSLGDDTYKYTGVVSWNLGDDSITDSAGTDTLDFSGLSTGITVNLSLTSQQTIYSQGGTPRLRLTLVSNTTIENVVGTLQADTITGNTLNNFLRGGGGNDSLFGAGSADTLEGGAGNDALDGGSGSDIYLFSGASNLGNDTITEAAGSDEDLLNMSSMSANLAIDLGLVSIQIIAENLLSLTIVNSDSIEDVTTGSGNDTITGNALDNTLAGGTGSDTYVFSGSFDLGADTISETEDLDSDELDLSALGVDVNVNLTLNTPHVIAIGLLTLTLANGAAIENVYCGSGNDIVTGNSRNNLISGGDGDDYLHGNSGEDSIYGEEGSDLVYGGVGNDHVFGQDGDDAIYGGAGDDVLNGGAGNDVYWFGPNTGPLENDEIIEDPSADSDVIDFSAFVTNVLIDLTSINPQPVVPDVLSLKLSNSSAIESVIGGTNIGAQGSAWSLIVSTLDDVNDGNFLEGHLSLREALAIAAIRPGSDPIIFSPNLFAGGHQSILLQAGQLVIDSDVTIDGPGSSKLTIDAHGGSRVFAVNSNVNATISDLEITGGSNANGGGVHVAGTLNLTSVAVVENTATYGGGIYVTQTGSLALVESTIEDNVATAGGGAIYSSQSGTTLLNDSAIVGNSSGGHGGGIFALGTITIGSTTIANNTAAYNGGGIYTVQSAHVSVNNSILEANTATGGHGGGVYAAGSTYLEWTTVIGNTAGYHGAGIYLLQTGSLTVSGSVIEENTAIAGSGAGVYSLATAIIDTSTIANNSAAIQGGGIYVSQTGTLTLADCAIDDNTAGISGGGIYQYAGAGEHLRISGSTISNNSANGGSGIGGGLYFFTLGGGSPVTGKIINSTISNNSADIFGGGIHVSDSRVDLTIVNSTIAENTAGSRAGLEITSGAKIRLHNSIVADNLTDSSDLSNLYGSLYEDSHNLIGEDVGLTPLAKRGGRMKTHGLLPGSAAINAGSNSVAVNVDGTPLQNDQRGTGFARIGGTNVDIGAFEFGVGVHPTISIASGGSGTIEEGDTVTFNLYTDGETVSEWLINWGDESESTELPGSAVSAQHLFAVGTGEYIVVVTVFHGGFTYTSEPLAITVQNSAPILNDEYLVTSIPQDANPLTNKGVSVANLTTGIVDRNSADSKGVAIVDSDETRGPIEYSLNGGATWQSVGEVSESQALLLPTTARVRLNATSQFNGSLSSAIVFHAWDQTAGLAGQKVDLAALGDGSAISVETDVLEVVEAAVLPNAPTVTQLSLANSSPNPDGTITPIFIGVASNPSGSRSGMLIEYDINRDGITDGQVFTNTNDESGSFSIDLREYFLPYETVKIAARAIAYDVETFQRLEGGWKTYEFNNTAPTALPVQDRHLPSAEVMDRVNGYFASLVPSILQPTLSEEIVFEGQALPEASFGSFIRDSFTNRFNPHAGASDLHIVDNDETPTVSGPYTVVDTSEWTIDVGGNASSWTYTETFTYTYSASSSGIDFPSGASWSNEQWGTYSYVFNAFANGNVSEYTLTETRLDNSDYEWKHMTEFSTQHGTGTTTKLYKDVMSQDFELIASGKETITGSDKESKETWNYVSGGSSDYYNEYKNTDPRLNGAVVNTIITDGLKQWTYESTNERKTTNLEISYDDDFTYVLDIDEEYRDKTETNYETVEVVESGDGNRTTTRREDSLWDLNGLDKIDYTYGGIYSSTPDGTTTDVGYEYKRQIDDHLLVDSDIAIDIVDNLVTTRSIVSHVDNTTFANRTRKFVESDFGDTFDGKDEITGNDKDVFVGKTQGSNLTTVDWTTITNSRVNGTDNTEPAVTRTMNSRGVTTEIGASIYTFGTEKHTTRDGAVTTSYGDSRGDQVTSADGMWLNATNSAAEGTFSDGSSNATFSGSDSSLEFGTSYYLSAGWEEALLDTDGEIYRSGGGNYTAVAVGFEIYNGNSKSETTTDSHPSAKVTVTTTSKSEESWNGKMNFVASASGSNSWDDVSHFSLEKSDLSVDDKRHGSIDASDKVVRADTNTEGEITNSTDTADYSELRDTSSQLSKFRQFEDDNGAVNSTSSVSSSVNATANTETNTGSSATIKFISQHVNSLTTQTSHTNQDGSSKISSNFNQSSIYDSTLGSEESLKFELQDDGKYQLEGNSEITVHREDTSTPGLLQVSNSNTTSTWTGTGDHSLGELEERYSSSDGLNTRLVESTYESTNRGNTDTDVSNSGTVNGTETLDLIGEYTRTVDSASSYEEERLGTFVDTEFRTSRQYIIYGTTESDGATEFTSSIRNTFEDHGTSKSKSEVTSNVKLDDLRGAGIEQRSENQSHLLDRGQGTYHTWDYSRSDVYADGTSGSESDFGDESDGTTDYEHHVETTSNLLDLSGLDTITVDGETGKVTFTGTIRTSTSKSVDDSSGVGTASAYTRSFAASYPDLTSTSKFVTWNKAENVGETIWSVISDGKIETHTDKDGHKLDSVETDHVERSGEGIESDSSYVIRSTIDSVHTKFETSQSEAEGTVSNYLNRNSSEDREDHTTDASNKYDSNSHVESQHTMEGEGTYSTSSAHSYELFADSTEASGDVSEHKENGTYSSTTTSSGNGSNKETTFATVKIPLKEGEKGETEESKDKTVPKYTKTVTHNVESETKFTDVEYELYDHSENEAKRDDTTRSLTESWQNKEGNVSSNSHRYASLKEDDYRTEKVLKTVSGSTTEDDATNGHFEDYTYSGVNSPFSGLPETRTESSYYESGSVTKDYESSESTVDVTDNSQQDKGISVTHHQKGKESASGTGPYTRDEVSETINGLSTSTNYNDYDINGTASTEGYSKTVADGNFKDEKETQHTFHSENTLNETGSVNFHDIYDETVTKYADDTSETITTSSKVETGGTGTIIEHEVSNGTDTYKGGLITHTKEQKDTTTTRKWNSEKTYSRTNHRDSDVSFSSYDYFKEESKIDWDEKIDVDAEITKEFSTLTDLTTKTHDKRTSKGTLTEVDNHEWTQSSPTLGELEIYGFQKLTKDGSTTETKDWLHDVTTTRNFSDSFKASASDTKTEISTALITTHHETGFTIDKCDGSVEIIFKGDSHTTLNGTKTEAESTKKERITELAGELTDDNGDTYQWKSKTTAKDDVTRSVFYPYTSHTDSVLSKDEDGKEIWEPTTKTGSTENYTNRTEKHLITVDEDKTYDDGTFSYDKHDEKNSSVTSGNNVNLVDGDLTWKKSRDEKFYTKFSEHTETIRGSRETADYYKEIKHNETITDRSTYRERKDIWGETSETIYTFSDKDEYWRNDSKNVEIYKQLEDDGKWSTTDFKSNYSHYNYRLGSRSESTVTGEPYVDIIAKWREEIATHDDALYTYSTDSHKISHTYTELVTRNTTSRYNFLTDTSTIKEFTSDNDVTKHTNIIDTGPNGTKQGDQWDISVKDGVLLSNNVVELTTVTHQYQVSEEAGMFEYADYDTGEIEQTTTVTEIGEESDRGANVKWYELVEDVLDGIDDFEDWVEDTFSEIATEIELFEKNPGAYIDYARAVAWETTTKFIDAAMGIFDGFVDTINPLNEWIDIPNIGPIYGHYDAYRVGYVGGIILGIGAGIYVGNFAAGAGLFAGGALRTAAQIYGAVDTAAGIYAAYQHAQQGKFGIMDVVALAPLAGFMIGKLDCFVAGTPVWMAGSAMVVAAHTIGPEDVKEDDEFPNELTSITSFAAAFIPAIILLRLRKHREEEDREGEIFLMANEDTSDVDLDRDVDEPADREERVLDTLFESERSWMPPNENLAGDVASHSLAPASMAPKQLVRNPPSLTSRAKSNPPGSIAVCTHQQKKHSSGGLHTKRLALSEQKPAKPAQLPANSSARASLHKNRRIAEWAAALCVLLCLGMGAWFAAWGPNKTPNARVPIQEAAFFPSFGTSLPSSDPVHSPVGPYTKPIEQVRLGERVLADNPDPNKSPNFLSEPDQATWRRVEMLLIQSEDDLVHIELLRPVEWIEHLQLKARDVVELELPEIGARGATVVLSIGPCPKIHPGGGRVVTGAFCHLAENLVDVTVGDSPSIGCTATHPFWSEDRHDYVAAGQLRIGEKLRTHDNRVLALTNIVPRAGPEFVYNLEVNLEHVYHVGRDGVLVHNICILRGRFKDHVVYHGTRDGLPYVGRASAPSRLKLSAEEIVARRYGGKGNVADKFSDIHYIHAGSGHKGYRLARGLEQHYFNLNLKKYGDALGEDVGNKIQPISDRDKEKAEVLKEAQKWLREQKAAGNVP